MKRYILSFVLAVFVHFLVFIIPKNGGEENSIEDNLISIQLLNEEPAKKPSPPVKKTPPPPPPKKVIPKPIPKEVVPEKEEIAEEEVIKKEVVSKPVTPQKTKVSKPSPTKSTPGPQTVDANTLDNANFKPFGNKEPIYPSLAKKAGIEGWVKIQVLVNKKGKVVKVKVLDYSGHTSFKTATIAVAKGWRFPIPTIKNQRTQAWYIQKVGFKLRD